ncbi:MAG: tetratricopeptide repeat protein [Burkholderiaceae bacterium]
MKSRSIFQPLPIFAALTASLLLSACAGAGTQPSDSSQAGNSPTVRDARAQPVNTDRKLAQGGPARLNADTRGPEPEPAASIPEVDLSPQLLFQLLMSEIAAQRGQLGSAAATYLSMARETRDPRLARRATELALSGRALQQALPAAELWYELSPTSPLAGQTLETLWLSTGKLIQAEPLMAQRRAVAQEQNDLPEFYTRLRRSIARVTDKAAALRLLERIASKDLDITEARLALASAASAARNSGRALTEAQAAIDLDPDNELTAISAATTVQRASDDRAPAIGLLSTFLERKPKAIEARFAYARLLAEDNRKEDAKAQFEQALAQEPESPAILFSLAQLAYQTEQKKVAAEYLRRYVGLPATVQRDNNPAWLFLGQIAEEAKDWLAADKAYAEITEGEQYLDARIRRAIVIGRQGRLAEGRKLLQTTTVGSARERGRLTSAEAQILRNANQYKEAYKVLDEAVARQGSDADLLYDHAMAAERVDKTDVMESSLRKVMKLRPQSAHAYNALGYTLADRNERLDEAEKLIRKALELAPKDAHILDSMGWVLFRRGDLKGAEKYLREALAIADEAEIATHLGEVLHRQGRTSEARKYWAQARSRDPENDILRKTLARLNINL